MSHEHAAPTEATSVAVIMDGNRRWADARQLLAVEGHTAGYAKLKELVTWAPTQGITTLYAYAFSEKNWQRNPVEISGILALLKRALTSEIDELATGGARLRFLSAPGTMPDSFQRMMWEAETKTAHNTKLDLAIAFSYGGRSEITDAFNRLYIDGKRKVTPEDVSASLWTAGLADPQLIIRSGGGRNLSDFLTWEATDADFVPIDTLWPDVSMRELEREREAYAKRPHRNGI